LTALLFRRAFFVDSIEQFSITLQVIFPAELNERAYLRRTRLAAGHHWLPIPQPSGV